MRFLGIFIHLSGQDETILFCMINFALSLITLLYKWRWLSITTSYQDQQLCTIGVERALLQSIFGKAVVVAALAKNASGSSLPPTCTTLHFVHVLPYKVKVKLMSLPENWATTEFLSTIFTEILHTTEFPSTTVFLCTPENLYTTEFMSTKYFFNFMDMPSKT